MRKKYIVSIICFRYKGWGVNYRSKVSVAQIMEKLELEFLAPSGKGCRAQSGLENPSSAGDQASLMATSSGACTG